MTNKSAFWQVVFFPARKTGEPTWLERRSKIDRGATTVLPSTQSGWRYCPIDGVMAVPHAHSAETRGAATVTCAAWLARASAEK
jgi:hypothetical protein